MRLAQGHKVSEYVYVDDIAEWVNVDKPQEITDKMIANTTETRNQQSGDN